MIKPSLRDSVKTGLGTKVESVCVQKKCSQVLFLRNRRAKERGN